MRLRMATMARATPFESARRCRQREGGIQPGSDDRQKAPVTTAIAFVPVQQPRCEAKRRNLSVRESLFPNTLNCAIFGCF
jgi:hypothetical protein